MADTTAADFDIPGMPSDAALEAEILGADPRAAPGSSVFSTSTAGAKIIKGGIAPDMVPDGLREAWVAAKIKTGLSEDATPYAREQVRQARVYSEASDKVARLTSQIAEVAGYDPRTGEPIPAHSPDRIKAMRYEIESALETMDRLDGEVGRRQLEAALKESVAQRKAQLKAEYVEREAQKRAEQMQLNQLIEERARTIARLRPSE